MINDKILEHVISVIKDLKEEAPTMSVGTGDKMSLPPTHEPPGKPKKRYIYQKNTRKNW